MHGAPLAFIKRLRPLTHRYDLVPEGEAQNVPGRDVIDLIPRSAPVKFAESAAP